MLEGLGSSLLGSIGGHTVEVVLGGIALYDGGLQAVMARGVAGGGSCGCGCYAEDREEGRDGGEDHDEMVG